MRTTKVLGVSLLALGLLVIVFRGFTYTEERHSADLGVMQVEVEEKERLRIPLWVGVTLAVGGGALLLVPSRSGG